MNPPIGGFDDSNPPNESKQILYSYMYISCPSRYTYGHRTECSVFPETLNLADSYTYVFLKSSHRERRSHRQAAAPSLVASGTKRMADFLWG